MVGRGSGRDNAGRPGVLGGTGGRPGAGVTLVVGQGSGVALVVGWVSGGDTGGRLGVWG